MVRREFNIGLGGLLIGGLFPFREDKINSYIDHKIGLRALVRYKESSDVEDEFNEYLAKFPHPDVDMFETFYVCDVPQINKKSSIAEVSNWVDRLTIGELVRNHQFHSNVEELIKDLKPLLENNLDHVMTTAAMVKNFDESRTPITFKVEIENALTYFDQEIILLTRKKDLHFITFYYTISNELIEGFAKINKAEEFQAFLFDKEKARNVRKRARTVRRRV